MNYEVHVRVCKTEYLIYMQRVQNTGQEVFGSYFYILIIKANEMHSFSNLFDNVLYKFRIDPLSFIRRIPTLYIQQQVFVMLVLLAVY